MAGFSGGGPVKLPNRTPYGGQIPQMPQVPQAPAVQPTANPWADRTWLGANAPAAESRAWNPETGQVEGYNYNNPPAKRPAPAVPPPVAKPTAPSPVHGLKEAAPKPAPQPTPKPAAPPTPAAPQVMRPVQTGPMTAAPPPTAPAPSGETVPTPAGGGGGVSLPPTPGVNAPIDTAALAGLQAAAQPLSINPTPMGEELGTYLGQRTPPQYDNILAGLRRIY